MQDVSLLRRLLLFFSVANIPAYTDRAITHNFVFDTAIGLFIADFCCGLSLGWWKSSHNVHHLITNMPVCLDPLSWRPFSC